MAALAEHVGAIRGRLPGGDDAAFRWVAPDAYHVTLRFVGATDPGRLPDVANAVEEAAATGGRFEASVGALSVLGGGRTPTLVARLVAGAGDAATLERAVSAALTARGWPLEDRPFRPHLTVARGRAHADARPAVRAIVAGEPPDPIRWTVERIVVVESRLGSGPPRYRERAAALLG